MVSIDPATLARVVVAVFELRDGELHATWYDGGPLSFRAHLERGIATSAGIVPIRDPAAFFEVLPKAYATSTFVDVVDGPPDPTTELLAPEHEHTTYRAPPGGRRRRSTEVRFALRCSFPCHLPRPKGTKLAKPLENFVRFLVRSAIARWFEERAQGRSVSSDPQPDHVEVDSGAVALPWDVDGWKAIAERIGMSVRGAQGHRDRDPPIPVYRYGGKIVGKGSELDAWNEERKRRPRRAKRRSNDPGPSAGSDPSTPLI